MKYIILLSLLLSLFAILYPLSAALNNPYPTLSAPDPEINNKPDFSAKSDTDASFSVKLLTEGNITVLPLDEYLIGVLGAEMPASFEDEALKAQAVAARTYTLYKMFVSPSSAHPDADVCDDVNCCKAYSSPDKLREKWGDDYLIHYEKISAAVSSTDGECLLYEGEPILAAFHSSSPGRTEASENVWQTALPYLRPTDSPETADDVPDYISSVSLSLSEFKETISAQYPDALFDTDPAEWISETSYTESGRISRICIGGINLTGSELRALFGLRSAYIDISVTDSAVVLTVSGYGHGVGMSQYGANVMAKRGSTYSEILLHYYQGTKLGHMHLIE